MKILKFNNLKNFQKNRKMKKIFNLSIKIRIQKSEIYTQVLQSETLVLKFISEYKSVIRIYFQIYILKY